MAQHISLKFQNDTANEGLRLYLFGSKLSKLLIRNAIGTNYKGTHISLRFRNNSSGESLHLQTLGLGIIKLVEQ